MAEKIKIAQIMRLNSIYELLCNFKNETILKGSNSTPLKLNNSVIYTSAYNNQLKLSFLFFLTQSSKYRLIKF